MAKFSRRTAKLLAQTVLMKEESGDSESESDFSLLRDLA